MGKKNRVSKFNLPLMRRSVKIATSIILGLVPISQTIYLWLAKKSISLSIGGLPVSDSTGWTSCIKSLAYFGQFPTNAEEFCSRRPTYPVLASLLFKLLDSNFLLQLLLSSLFGLAIFFFTNNFAKKHNLLAAGSVSGLFNLLWFRWAATQDMTESMGLILGVLLAAFSIDFFKSTKAKTYCYTLALLLSSVRPGNLFLPIVFALVISISAISLKRFNRILLAISLITFAFSMDKFVSLLGRLNGQPNFNTGGNLWSVLYGLSDKNQSWSYVYGLPEVQRAQSEAEFWTIVQRLTLENIMHKPWVIVQNMGSNIVELFNTQIPFFFPTNTSFTPSIVSFYKIMILLSLLILIVWIVRYKSFSTEFLMWIMIVLSTLISYGVGWKSDPLRTMSPYQPLSLVAFYSIFFSVNGPMVLLSAKKRQKLKNQLNQSRGKNAKLQIPVENFDLGYFFLRTSSIFTIFGILLTLPFHIASANTNELKKICPTNSAIELIPKTIDYRQISRLELPTQYWWANQIKNLNPGYLIQGLGKDLTHYNLYLDEPKDFNFSKKEQYCFSVIENSTNRSELDALGYIQVSLLLS